MGKFAEKKAELKQQVQEKKTSSGKIRTTHSESAFNNLATALLNDPDYQDVSVTKVDGKPEQKVTKPVADLRKVMIGSVLKDAGVDAAEAAKIIAEHEFPTVPMYGYTAALLEEYLDTGKGFTFQKREDLEATLRMETVPEVTKVITNQFAGSDGNSKPTFTQVCGEHRRIRVKSTCPAGRKTRI